MDFRDRHVVVTGGTGALGTALVGMLLEAGAFCRVIHRSAQPGDFAHRKHARVTLASGVDLADEQAVAEAFAGIPALWASIHVAGGFAYAPVVETDRKLLMQQVETNLVTAFLCSRAAVKAMLAGKDGGRIVNVAARPALEWRSGANMAAYTASKAAVAALTVALAEEVAKDGILVNAVAPAIMDTAANRDAMPSSDPVNWPKVEDVARTILFLAAPENRVTRGAVVPVYGSV